MRQFANAVQNQPIDMSEEFAKQENHFFIGSKIAEFDPRSARLQMSTQIAAIREDASPMLEGEPGTDDSWETSSTESSTTYRSRFGAVTVTRDPLRFEFR